MKLYDNDAYRDEFMALVYSLLQNDGTNDRANQIIDAFDRAPEIEAEPLLPNGPLTLDELREMDGEPVWVIPLDDFDILPANYLVNAYAEQIVVDKFGAYLDFEDYGKTWMAYRRKPEEE